MIKIEEFLKVLYPSLDGFIEIRTIHPTTRLAEAHFYSSIDELLNNWPLIDSKRIEQNVYFGVCSRRVKEGNKKAIKNVWSLWADLDAKDFRDGKEEALNKLNSFPISPTIVIDSGNGFHSYWRLKEPIEVKNDADILMVEEYLQALSLALGADTASAELARILRLPGTLNHKDPEALKEVSVIKFHPNQQCNLGDFDSFLTIPLSQNNEQKNHPGWLSETLSNMQEGNRNSSFAKIIGKLHQSAFLSEDIYALLSPLAQQRKFSLEELQGEINGICKRYPNNNSFLSTYNNSREMETEILPFVSIKLSDFLEQSPKEISWVVENILPQEGVGILAGPAGYGKSWMMLDLAIECARGGKWLGQFNTFLGSVLYVDEESASALLNKRLNKLLNGKNVSKESLDIHFALGQGLCLNKPSSVDKLRERIDTLKPRLVIVDSLIRVHRAEENSSKEMAQISSIIQKIVREYKCTFLFADHQRKPSNFSVGLDLLLRGSSEKLAFLDSLLSLRRGKDKILIVEHSKSRYVQEVPSFMVDIKDLSPEVTQVIYTGEAEAHLQIERLRTVGNFLEVALEQGQWMPRKDLVEKAKQIQMSEKMVDGALKNYVDSGLIERDDRKPAFGPGGKTAFYRLRKNDMPLFPIQGIETEMNSNLAEL